MSPAFSVLTLDQTGELRRLVSHIFASGPQALVGRLLLLENRFGVTVTIRCASAAELFTPYTLGVGLAAEHSPLQE